MNARQRAFIRLQNRHKDTNAEYLAGHLHDEYNKEWAYLLQQELDKEDLRAS